MGVAGRRALLLAQAVVLALWPAAHLLMIDLQVYRAGGEHLLTGSVALRRRGAARPAVRLPAVRCARLRAADGASAAGPQAGLDARGCRAGGVRRPAFGGAGRDAGESGGDRAAGGGAARARPDPHDVLPGTDQRRAARRGARRRHRAAGAAARGRGGARGGGEAHAAGLRRLPDAHRPGAGRGDGAGDVRRGGRRRVPRRAGGLGHLLVGGTFAAADRISPVASTANHSLDGLLARAGAPGWVGLAATACSRGAGWPSRCSPTDGAKRCSG